METEGAWKQKRWIFSAVFVGLLVVAGVWLFLSGSSQPDQETTSDQNQSDHETSSPISDPDVEDSICGLEPDANSSMETPPESDWQTVGTISVPTGDEFGPAEESQGVPTCWQYSEAGAVSASFAFVAIGTDAPRLGQAHVEEHYAEGPGRDVMLSELDEAGSMGTESAQIQPVGYRVLDFDESGENGAEARIDVLMEPLENPGTYGALTYELTWEDGDWKTSVQDTGESFHEVRDIQSPDEFTLWEE